MERKFRRQLPRRFHPLDRHQRYLGLERRPFIFFFNFAILFPFLERLPAL